MLYILKKVLSLLGISYHITWHNELVMRFKNKVRIINLDKWKF